MRLPGPNGSVPILLCPVWFAISWVIWVGTYAKNKTIRCRFCSAFNFKLNRNSVFIISSLCWSFSRIQFFQELVMGGFLMVFVWILSAVTLQEWQTRTKSTISLCVLSRGHGPISSSCFRQKILLKNPCSAITSILLVMAEQGTVHVTWNFGW